MSLVHRELSAAVVSVFSVRKGKTRRCPELHFVCLTILHAHRISFATLEEPANAVTKCSGTIPIRRRVKNVVRKKKAKEVWRQNAPNVKVGAGAVQKVVYAALEPREKSTASVCPVRQVKNWISSAARTAITVTNVSWDNRAASRFNDLHGKSCRKSAAS